MKTYKHYLIFFGTIALAISLGSVMYFVNNDAVRSFGSEIVACTFITDKSFPIGNDGAFSRQMQHIRGHASSVESGGSVYEADTGTDLSEVLAELKPGDVLLLKDGVYPKNLNLRNLHGTEEAQELRRIF